MDVLECIQSRKSVRKYISSPIEMSEIKDIISAAICAPSGKNGQPWRFCIIKELHLINSISKLSVYYSWMRRASVLILTFLDHAHSYNYVKDVQSCGAAMQNMLLASYAMHIGSCWIGELLDKSNEVKTVLDIEDENLELMGIVALGHYSEEPVNVGRKSIDYFLI